MEEGGEVEQERTIPLVNTEKTPGVVTNTALEGVVASAGHAEDSFLDDTASSEDNYETIKKQMANYLKTGETETPTRGRGHRVQKKPTHNEWASYEEDEDSFAPEKPKKRKCLKRSDASMLSLVKEKYSLDNAIDNEDSDKGDEDHEVSELRRKNQGLQKKCQRLEGEVIDLKQEVRDMREIMLNMKESSKVNQALTELTKTIKLLHSHRPLKGRSSSSSSSSLSRSSSPSTLVKTNQHFKETTAVNEDNQSDDSDSDMVVIYPGISVLKAQKKMLDMCGDAKTYTYTLMEIIWSREVLASHSMTGKPSNAHKDKEPKPCLDIVKVKALCGIADAPLEVSGGVSLVGGTGEIIVARISSVEHSKYQVRGNVERVLTPTVADVAAASQEQSGSAADKSNTQNVEGQRGSMYKVQSGNLDANESNANNDDRINADEVQKDPGKSRSHVSTDDREHAVNASSEREKSNTVDKNKNDAEAISTSDDRMDATIPAENTKMPGPLCGGSAHDPSNGVAPKSEGNPGTLLKLSQDIDAVANLLTATQKNDGSPDKSATLNAKGNPEILVKQSEEHGTAANSLIAAKRDDGDPNKDMNPNAKGNPEPFLKSQEHGEVADPQKATQTNDEDGSDKTDGEDDVQDTSVHSDEKRQEKETWENTGKKRKKKKKKQKKKKNKSQQLTGATCQDVIDDGQTKTGVTVIFHALLSPKWGKKSSVGIRGGTALFYRWQQTVVTMESQRSTDEKYDSLRGVFVIPMSHIRKKIEYKYVVAKGQNIDYEELVEFSSGCKGHVNRCLVLPTSIRENEIWHQYDGFIHPKPQFGSSIVTWFFGEVLHREYVVKEFFPLWDGFFPNIKNDNLTAITAVKQLDMLLNSTSSVWITDHNRCIKKDVPPSNLDIPRVLVEVLAPKVKSNIEVVSNNSGEANVIVKAIISSVVITSLFHRYCVNLNGGLLVELLMSLRIPPNIEVCSGLMREIHQLENSVLRDLVKSLCDLCDHTINQWPVEKSWLHILPLIHFLREDSDPFVESKHVKQIQYDEWKWWGLEGIKVREFLIKISYSSTVSKGGVIDMSDLEKLFPMDLMMKRTFLLLCPVNMFDQLFKTRNFSAVEMCNTMRRMLPEFNNYNELFIASLTSFFSLIKEDLLQSDACSTDERWQEDESLMETFQKLLEMLLGQIKIHQTDVICRLIEVISAQIRLKKNCGDSQTSTDAYAHHIRESGRKVICFLERKLSSYMNQGEQRLFEELLAWSTLLSVKTSDEELDKLWQDLFMRELKQRVQKVAHDRVIRIFCMVGEQNLHFHVKECLSTAAFAAVNEIMKYGGSVAEDAFNSLSKSAVGQGSGNDYGNLLCIMLSNAWPKGHGGCEANNQQLIYHLLTWQTWEGFLKYFGRHTNHKIILSEEGQMMMSQAESCLEDLINTVQDRSITVECLNSLIAHSEQFLVLAEITQKAQKAAEHRGEIPIRDSFYQSRRELQAFQQDKNMLKDFLDYCDCFKSVNQDFKEIREKVDEDCKSRSVHDLCVQTSAGIEVTFFNLDHSMKSMISDVSRIQKSQIFNLKWEDACENLQEDPVTMQHILNYVWIPVNKDVQNIQEGFFSGKMMMKQVDKYLKLMKGNLDNLNEEFELLVNIYQESNGITEREKKKITAILSNRVEQVKDYQRLFAAHKAAQTIMKFKEEMKLTGNFNEVEEISKVTGTFANHSLDSVTKELVLAAEKLKDVTPQREECLSAFLECQPLVTWLKEKMKDQELKVFVDLALISAGESDVEIHRISSMHTSCLGFGPLIYRLKSDDGFRELLDHCKTIWESVETIPTLPMKLKETNRVLNWLKEIKESMHGTVEFTTMKQVESINASGIYHVGSLDLDFVKSTRNESSDSSLENTVYLLLPADTAIKREGKKYTLEEIKDIQSKLMLIAGKAVRVKGEVEQFVEVFEGVLRIGGLHANLCETGEINYLTWKQEFQNINTPIGRQELLDRIEQVCSQMEEDLEKWKEQIEGSRSTCYPLNLFSMKQVLKLRNELAFACKGRLGVDEMPLQVYSLLESVRCDVDPFVLASNFERVLPQCSWYLAESEHSRENFFREDESDNEDDDDHSDVSESSSSASFHVSIKARKSSTENFDDAREVLSGSGCSNEVIIASLAACGRRAVADELIAWAINNEDDDALVEQYYQEASNDAGLLDLLLGFDENDNEKDDDAPESYGEDGENTATDQEEPTREEPHFQVFETLANGKSQDYLTLHALIIVLNGLSSAGTCSGHQRKFPSNFIIDEPNLLLVPKGDVFASVLTLFMVAGDQPLPTNEEVIICDEKTTAEEVELLWRRAVVDSNGLLFCLANADLLDYDVSQQAVLALDQITQGKQEYHIIVICSTENENRAHMVAALDQYRRPFTPLTSVDGVRSFLSRKMKVNVMETSDKSSEIHREPAGVVDKDCLSVRVLQSSRAGVGKSLLVKRLTRKIEDLENNKRLKRGIVQTLCPTIPVHGVLVDPDKVTKALLKHAIKTNIPVSRIFHLDISESAIKGLDTLLFNMLILQCIKDSDGNVWRRKSSDLYVVEITTDTSFSNLVVDEVPANESHHQSTKRRRGTARYSFLKFLPMIHCLTPRETLDNLVQNRKGDTGFDIEIFRSDEYQRAFQYLTMFASERNMDNFHFKPRRLAPLKDGAQALEIIIKYCGIRDPSWTELRHFVNFLNSQLSDFERNIYCDSALVGDILHGFRTFVVRFLIQMSRDFATRSLNDSRFKLYTTDEEDELNPFQIRRRWELSPHPYIFFNYDCNSMTFLGFLLSRNGDLLNPANNETLEERIISPILREELKLQGVNFDENYETWNRQTRITNLCRVMGIADDLYDPDPTYELTTDNVEKILAIHMRFRCIIPVIIMGETGCGKTRLIRFMSELQAGRDGPKNMLLMKVHGGTSYEDIEEKVEEAVNLARENNEKDIDTTLFFDEANTTDAIDLIKEIMVDKRLNGRCIQAHRYRLHFIAACNPYRKHTTEMINKLESAGLGYHVTAQETEDKLGSIPLRQLVYRVHPLPESMRPLVWDFGQLTEHTEELYTKLIVQRFVKLPAAIKFVPVSLLSPGPSTVDEQSNTAEDVQFIHCNKLEESCIAEVLAASQKYMRQQKNECSFVSLRDVERAMKVITWFYVNANLLSSAVDHVSDNEEESSSSDEDSDDEIGSAVKNENYQPLTRIARALVLGIGVCYYARLYKREEYCTKILNHFKGPCMIPGGAFRMMYEISRCQKSFLNNVRLAENIAKNAALSENVFMMAICTELRIPLFVVGKPGSSKSLAKDVISTNMLGDSSESKLFKGFKQIIHMQSYQCSPLSTSDGIVTTFRQCAKLQKDKILDKFVSVVVLDEVGLAEDSPLMPLKTLHPLLEDGTATEEENAGKSVEYTRVGFIGLSNWALDPAKMNRGIMLNRGVPSTEELVDSAMGICSSNKHLIHRIEDKIGLLAEGYERLYASQKDSETLKRAKKEEFFGLRDFYSLVKMVCAFAVEKTNHRIGPQELEKAIKRNFSGLDDIDPMPFFSNSSNLLKECIENPSPECHPVCLIKQSLQRNSSEGESRYLLVLTENYAALSILRQQLLEETDHDPVVIFGSSFPKDQQYTQICRNINRIKVCMETGRMVILLNLESLYESLYDALNQYYMYMGDQKYVDLGLGNHRVKCRVDDGFKLIVIAEKDVVYQRFPIPLINRLEKHFLVMSTGLTTNQYRLVEKLVDWIKMFSDAKKENLQDGSAFKPGDSFVGYHSDTAAAVVMQVSEHPARYTDEQILDVSKCTILQCACPDAVARLPLTSLTPYAKEFWSLYFDVQKHNSLSEYLYHVLREKGREKSEGVLVQVTTHSRLLSQSDAKHIATAVGFQGTSCRCISLQEFHTQQQFTKAIESFCVGLGGHEGLLLIQCDNGEINFNLVACSRYLVVDIRQQAVEDFGTDVRPIHIVFIVNLPKILGGCQNFVGFQGGKWLSVHVDELRQSNEQLPCFDQLLGRSVSDLLQPFISRVSRVDAEAVDIDPPGELERSFLTNTKSEQNINPTLILRNCLQEAASRVYDDSVNINRATRRIEILSVLLPQDSSNDTDISIALVRRVHQLLKERDEKCWQDQRLWLQNEALSRGRLQETGTFRKALWKKLSSVVSPILSEVVAFADCNQNLDLLRDEDSWKHRLWIAMLMDEQVTPLSYDSFVSPVSNLIRERACVKPTGAGHNFRGRFPFSWVIKDMVNELLIHAMEASRTKAGVVSSLRGVLDSSPLGGLLKHVIVEDEVKQCATMDYLHDFLHMVYKTTVVDEMELVTDALISAAKAVHRISNSHEEFALDISLIHVAHSLIQSRLACFADLVQAFPGVVKKLVQQRQRLNVEDMNLDLLAVECCIRELEPTRQQLHQSELRMTWCDRAQSLRPIIQVITRLIEELYQESHENSQTDNLVLSIGDGSIRILDHCRLGWVRLDVVRLFIEHTCSLGLSTTEAVAPNAFTLWKALGENLDFSSDETMAIIERFLSECTQQVNKRYLKYGITHCNVCMNPLKEPVEIPCQHVYCKDCARTWFADNTICPVCRQEVGDFDIVVNEECRKGIEICKSFSDRCKSFFMELVAVYCFGDESRKLPNAELVNKFIGYVIKEDNKTEDFTPFDGQAVDTTPVVRSFILQQLLAKKERMDEVHEHLEAYLKRAGGLAEKRDHVIEVVVLCVQCMEDVETTKLLKCKDARENTEICLATKMLERSLNVLSIKMRTPPHCIDITKLETVAATRAALEVLSTYLGKDYTTNLERFESLPSFLDVAKNICTGTGRSHIQLFLLKQLVRKFGHGIFKEICQNDELRWIFPLHNEQQEHVPDTFIVHHETYHTIREALAKTILSCNIDELVQVLQNLRNTPQPARDCYMLLSLFREITTRNAMDVDGGIGDKAMEMISEFLGETNHLTPRLKPLAGCILRNTHSRNVDMLRVSIGRIGYQRALAEVLVHFRIIMECLPDNILLQPLRNLAVDPASMQTSFLPTMPHDYGLEAMQANNIGRWYECPNGHRYVITECGRPKQTYTCPGCRAPIGGSGQLAAMNRAASRSDRSTTGHVIGSAQSQPQSLSSERNLSPLAFGVLRFLTHAALLLGADQNIQNVNAIIKPQVPNVIDFLQAHLQHDIRCLALSTGTNEDESMLIIHLILNGILNHTRHRQRALFEPRLTTKESRESWENAFVFSYLNPILSNFSEQLQECLARMIRDKRLGNDPLMRQIYELDTPSYDMENIDTMCPALWRYRTRVTVEHLKMKFQEYFERCRGSSRCEILEEFIKKEHLLRALQYLADILKFQRLLSEKFHRRMDRTEAENFSLGEFQRRAKQMKRQLKTLVASFRMAWKVVRPFLSENGLHSIPADLCALEVTDKTPISMFLPAFSGYGRCALALTSFLVSLHNDFIGHCKSLLEDKSSPLDVPLANITKAHLVSYDSEKDLLPMILSNCNYSLKVGEGTVVEYNWKALERQLVDRFIRGRPKLIHTVELFVFSKDVCDGEVFTTLKQKIQQVELSRAVQDQIIDEVNQLTDICDMLKSLQIAIGFLSSAGGQPTMLIREYLHTALKMEDKDGLKSSKARQACQLCHVISLWRLLSLERARILMRNKQDPFDDISEKVKKQLSKRQTFELSKGLHRLNVDLFVRELLEVILLYLKHVSDEQLHWTLSEYLDVILQTKDSNEFDELSQYLSQDILLEHAVETWKVACQKSEDYHGRM